MDVDRGEGRFEAWSWREYSFQLRSFDSFKKYFWKKRASNSHPMGKPNIHVGHGFIFLMKHGNSIPMGTPFFNLSPLKTPTEPERFFSLPVDQTFSPPLLANQMSP